MLSSTMPSTLMATTLQQPLLPSSTLILSTRRLPRRPQSHQQARNFRLSLWSSYLDPTFQKETRRRYRRVEKHRHIEALNRKLSWDRHFPIGQHAGLKGFMCSAWRGHDSRPGGRWVNVEDLKTISEKTQFNNEGSHDKFDRSRFESFVNNRESLYDFIRARSRIFCPGWTSMKPEPSNATSSTDPSPHGFTKSTTYGQEGFRRRFQKQEEISAEPAYEIDPITNRRAPKETQSKKASTDEIPVKTFEGYRSQFEDFEPPSSTAEPTSPEIIHSLSTRLKGYRKIGVETNDERDPVQEGLKSYDEKVDYESGRFYDCAGIDIDYSDPVQNGLKRYDNKISDGKACPENAAMANGGDAAHDGYVGYDANTFYRQGRPREEHKEQPGQNDPITQAMKANNSESQQPKMVKKTELKPEPLNPVEQAIREYEKSELYRRERKKRHADLLLKAIQDYQVNYQNVATNLTGAKLDAEKLNPVLRAIQEYESTALDEHQEPLDPILKAFREYKIAAQRTQDDSSREDGIPAPEQLKQLLQSIEENKSVVFQGAAADSQSQEKCPVQEGLKGYDAKVNHYQKPSEIRQATVKSLAFAPKPPAGTEMRIFAEDTTEDLDLLRTSDVRAASGIIKSPAKETESEKLAKRKELENNFDSFQNVTSSADEAAAAEKVHASRKLAEELRIEHSELLNHAAHARGRIDDKIAEVEGGWRPDTPTKKLSGNFARDFPEEFEAKWTATDVTSAGLTSQSKTESETDPLVGLAPESFSRDPTTPRMETSLDRSTSRMRDRSVETQNSASSIPIGLALEKHGESARSRRDKKEIRDRKNLVREIRGIYEEAYGTIDTKHRQVQLPKTTVAKQQSTSQSSGQTLQSPATAPPPTMYKILAYDPTMQSVSTAETTSIVPDSSDSLTPADVLLRLSNPSKFFPHFQSLQSQGYEIVAGSGDVLVFRKVRSGAPVLPKVETPAEAHAKAVTQERKRVTNPIDGMQSTPITGDFASPTGFVNYDLPRGTEAPFKSNIDVRREEPVFSGRRNWEDESEEEKPRTKGIGKRLLVGAAWVAACSYAVGVVSEFFRTGGMDGMGPQGF
ncbi:hypothetical protein ONS95_000947 [Cadophora gregata]|uniref:uncharacterized protein n=1 Tax=Cadophora gregata TaxID=51156 RepID=UPI0026DD4CA4|nr:uncharacterized protein ONS95_000947 [Cadophora gregata]KAK0129007.1 hypothetical protein ONS95_000947 [Cadophora gregata]